MSNQNELKTIERLQEQIQAMQTQIKALQKEVAVYKKEHQTQIKAAPAKTKKALQTKAEIIIPEKITALPKPELPALNLIAKLKEKIAALKIRIGTKKERLKTAKGAKPKTKPRAQKSATPKTKHKPSVAIVSLTCCEGCQVAIMDLGERFLTLSEKITIGDFAFLEDKPEAPTYDIVFVEGAPITKENILRLKDLRARSKYLVALGACAALGGIAEIKNYQDKFERMRYVYKNFEGINNPDIKPLNFYVKVDFEIPGCPINKEEFLRVAKSLIAGVPPKIAQRPICYECQLKQNECLLQKGLPCLGPVILNGCGATCPSNNYPCDGCRGPIKNVNPDKLNKQLMAQGYSQREIDLITQRFGMEDKIYPEPPSLKNNKLI